MAPNARPIPLDFLPGTQRDGTDLDGDRAIDALWCRWRIGRPRKINGFYETYDALRGISRRIHMFYNGSETIVHIGTSQSLEQVVIDNNGNFVSHADRTPAAFASGTNAGWTLDALFDTTSGSVQLLAHSNHDITVVADQTKSTPYIGLITDTAPLVPLTNPVPVDGIYTQPKVAGGIVCVQPYLFDFDIDGFIGWSAPNLPNYLGVSGGTSGAGRARASAQKIVAGMPLRGGGVNSPSALFWSLSEVISAQFVGSPAYFSFNTVSPSSSILSPQTVIEYDGLYFWAGIDRFLMYNGTVVEVDNQQNMDWFFDNMNWEQAGKSFATKVPRYGEIWFCAPLFGATEPSHAAIFNIREKCWYDTVLPNGGRGAGYFAQGIRYPLMGGTTLGDNGYSLWVHERGRDQVSMAGVPSAIRSYFTTPYLSGPKLNPPMDNGMSVQFIEPDIIQTGDMTVTVGGSANARDTGYSDVPVVLKAIPAIPQEQIVGFKTERRLATLTFESNTLGGNYITGKTILHGDPTDSRVTGGKSATTGGSPP